MTVQASGTACVATLAYAVGCLAQSSTLLSLSFDGGVPSNTAGPLEVESYGSPMFPVCGVGNGARMAFLSPHAALVAPVAGSNADATSFTAFGWIKLRSAYQQIQSYFSNSAHLLCFARPCASSLHIAAGVSAAQTGQTSLGLHIGGKYVSTGPGVALGEWFFIAVRYDEQKQAVSLTVNENTGEWTTLRLEARNVGGAMRNKGEVILGSVRALSGSNSDPIGAATNILSFSIVDGAMPLYALEHMRDTGSAFASYGQRAPENSLGASLRFGPTIKNTAARRGYALAGEVPLKNIDWIDRPGCEVRFNGVVRCRPAGPSHMTPYKTSSFIYQLPDRPFAISLWIRPREEPMVDESATTAKRMTILSKSGLACLDFALFLDRNYGEITRERTIDSYYSITFVLQDAMGRTHSVSTPRSALLEGLWSRILAVWDGRRVAVSVNGDKFSTSTHVGVQAALDPATDGSTARSFHLQRPVSSSRCAVPLMLGASLRPASFDSVTMTQNVVQATRNVTRDGIDLPEAALFQFLQADMDAVEFYSLPARFLPTFDTRSGGSGIDIDCRLDETMWRAHWMTQSNLVYIFEGAGCCEQTRAVVGANHAATLWGDGYTYHRSPLGLSPAQQSAVDPSIASILLPSLVLSLPMRGSATIDSASTGTWPSRETVRLRDASVDDSASSLATIVPWWLISQVRAAVVTTGEFAGTPTVLYESSPKGTTLRVLEEELALVAITAIGSAAYEGIDYDESNLTDWVGSLAGPWCHAGVQAARARGELSGKVRLGTAVARGELYAASLQDDYVRIDKARAIVSEYASPCQQYCLSNGGPQVVQRDFAGLQSCLSSAIGGGTHGRTHGSEARILQSGALVDLQREFLVYRAPRLPAGSLSPVEVRLRYSAAGAPSGDSGQQGLVTIYVLPRRDPPLVAGSRSSLRMGLRVSGSKVHDEDEHD